MISVIFKNPWLRSFIPIFLTGASGVFASSLIVEIASGSTIQWKQVTSKESFYYLLITTILLCCYQVSLYRYDQFIFAGISADEYEATLRNRVAEASAERARKLIKEGNISKLEEETETFKKLFGNG